MSAARLTSSRLGLAYRRNAGQVAFDVGRENRNAGFRQAFGEHLQCDGLAGAGRPGDQPVPIAEMQIEHFVFAALADDDLALGGRIVFHGTRGRWIGFRRRPGCA